jgi:hypothetical protein
MNRQSMAIVITIRIQDDCSSNVLTSFTLARPAGRYSGLRTDGPTFRTDPWPPLPTHAKEARSVYSRFSPENVGKIIS